MKKPLRILIPYDFSRFSQETLHFALSLKEPFAAEFLLLHVAPAGEVETFATLGGESEESGTRRLEEARGELERIAAVVRREHPGLKVDTRAVAGVPFKQICRLADEENFQLIVIGTHGRTGLSHLLIGSTAERVVQHASCPVLSIKPKML